MKSKIVFTILWCLFWWFITEYAWMPTWSFSAGPGIYCNLIFFLIVIGLIWYRWDDEKFSIPSNITGILSGILLLGIVIGGCGSCRVFQANKYQSLAGEVAETAFTSNIQPIAANQMVIVDEEIARRIGEKELGSEPGLGSRCELGTFTLQAVSGQLYWIAPLEHSGFFKWWRFDNEGSPGYIKVSATNQEDYALVKQVDGQKIKIIYQTGAYFSEDLSRHIYLNGFRSKLFGNFEFEVDDQWHPYWVVTVYDTKVWFAGKDATGVITISPETGEIREYTLKDAPSWIDRVHPQGFIKDQIDDWGRFIHGWPNWSGRDVKRVASESSVVLGSDGRSYYYFGLTSDGNDQSTIGFVMVDTRTKKSHWFKQSGATENAAKGSAEGKVQEKGYIGSDGITYNIDGHPTYEFLLKDKAGLMKLVSLVNVHDHTLVGIGENRYEAMQDYRKQMSNRGNAASISTSDIERETITSKINRFAPEVSKGSTYFYLTLEERPTMIFVAGSTVSNELPLSKEGDLVKVKYVLTNNPQEIPLLYFDNLNLGIVKDSLQVTLNTRVDSIRIGRLEKRSEEVVDAKWEQLTPDQKKKLLSTKKD